MQGENLSESLKRYLLGELSEEEMTAIEAAYFADDDTLIELHAVRDDLFDAWARGELRHDEAQSLSRQLARNPEWRERAAFAVHLHALSPAPKHIKTSSRWKLWLDAMPNWQWAAAAAVVVGGTILGTWWMSRHRTVDEAVPVAITAPTVTPNSPLPVASPLITVKPERIAPKPAASTDSSSDPSSGSSTHVLGLLLPVTTRDFSEVSEVMLKAETRVLRLQFELPSNDLPQMQLLLQDADGKKLWQSQPLRPHKQSDTPYVSCEVPVQFLSTGLHRVSLRSNDEKIVTQSAFRVAKP